MGMQGRKGKMGMRKIKKKKRCNCSICNNDIREEMQYAALKLGKDYIIFDVEEYEHFDEWMETRKDKQQPTYEEIEPENEKLQLVYGVIIPAFESNIEVCQEEMEKYKNYKLVSLKEKKLYISGYEDIKVFEDMKLYGNHIPCAILLNTSLELEKKRDYGFGYTMFLKFQDFEIFDNILNRQFLFCIRDIEETYASQENDWEKFIDKKKLETVARELF